MDRSDGRDPVNEVSPGSSLAKTVSTDAAQCVYIAGTGRNGSTLLGMLLLSDPRVFFAGELTHIWKRGFEQNQLCSCGHPFLCCEFWRAVVKDCFGDDCDAKVAEAARNRERISSFRNLARLKFGAAYRANYVDQYCETYRDLLASIARVSGCQTIVDSSKYPTDMAALIQGGVPLQVVHLVRDCRAVVYSWRTSKRRPEIHWKNEDMPRYGPVQTAVAWRTFNSLIEQIGLPSREAYRVLRYEDLVTDTATHCEQLFRWIGIDNPVEESGIALSDHSISGNPCRFNSGSLKVASDERWRKNFSRWERFIVNIVCRSMQKRYGYGD